MSIETFKDGSVLYTGNDIYKHFEKIWNKRNNYIENCDFCKYNNKDDDRCNECSIAKGLSCSCHISPPCSKCVNNGFEPTEYLINYENCYGKKREWECFPSTKEVFDKFNLIEKEGYRMSAEILTTGEICVYLDKDPFEGEKDNLEICKKQEFKKVATKMIIDFKLKGE